MSALQRLSSIRRLVQRLTSREKSTEAPASPTHMIKEHIQQQRSGSPAHLRRDSHLYHVDDKAAQTYQAVQAVQADRADSAILSQSSGQTSIARDVSDESVDDDAIELNVDDLFLAEAMTRLEVNQPQYITKSASSPVGEGSLDAILSEDTCSTEDDTALDTEQSLPFTASTDSTDNISLFEELSGHYFLALDAYNNDPLPFEDICPVVIEFAAQQLEQFNWSKLKSGRCLEQCGNDLRTVRWSQDVKYDKFACWTCSMTKESVCTRWLGGNAFLILPLLPRLRRQAAGPESLEYWVWGGPT